MLRLREVKKLAQGHTASGHLRLEAGWPGSRAPAFYRSVLLLSSNLRPSTLGGVGEAGQSQSCVKTIVGGHCVQNQAQLSAWLSRTPALH